MADPTPDTLHLAVPTADAVEALAGVLVGLDHTDDYVRAFGATLDELDEWERNSARDAARDLIAALTNLTSPETVSDPTPVQVWDACTDAHHHAAVAQGLAFAHPANPYRTEATS